MKKEAIRILLAILLTASACSIHQEMVHLPLAQPELSALEDGTYPGSFRKYRWHCRVEVDISGHDYDTIRVIDAANGGKRFYEQLVSSVLERQTIELDAFSGATISSRTFLKAVERAVE